MRPRRSDLIGRDSMTDAHFANFIAAIRTGEDAALADPGRERHGDHAAALEHRVVRESELKLDTETGHIMDDAEAMKYWARTYEKGWEVTV